MNKAVELVRHWGEFEHKFPAGSIEDFCRHYLALQKHEKKHGTLVGGVVPLISEGLLMKIISRIGKLNMAYANIALKGTELNQIEEFGILQTIKRGKNPKKTEVIYANLLELSSGTDMLNRMKKRGLIKEYADSDDKRSKRLELTAKGEKTAAACAEQVGKNAIMLTRDLDDNAKDLCIQLLKNIEIKFSSLWPKHKNKEFDDIYKELMTPTEERN